MGNQFRRNIAIGLIVMLCLVACSGSESAAEPSGAGEPSPASSPSPLSADEWCAAGADRVIERLEAFLGELPDISPEEFLALDEVEGLASFQNDVAQIIADTTDQSSTLCNLDGLQDLVGVRLQDVERNGVLAELLIATIRDGRELATADLAVEPGDDVASVLSLLDDGSTLTFGVGTYEVDGPLLVERSITFLGENVASTTIASTSPDAAIVVVGRGELIMRDLAVEHSGAAAASVVLAFNRPVDLRDVRLSGGVSDADGGAGNGLVLSDENFGGNQPDAPEKPRSVVFSSSITNNAGAGVAINGAVNPQLNDLEIAENGICGVCFFGASTGEVLNSTIRSNDFGIQIGDDSTPLVQGNKIMHSTTAGMAVIGNAAPVIELNKIDFSGEVGIAVQESASPLIADNDLSENLFGISVLSAGTVVLRDNTVSGGEIGIQVDERAMPLVQNNRILNPLSIGIAIGGQAGGRYLDNEIALVDGVGLVSDAEAAAVVDGLVVNGGDVAVAYAASTGGSLTNGAFTGQKIGIQIDGTAHPEISAILILDAVSAGIVARENSGGTASDIQITNAGEVGFAIGDNSDLALDGINVVGGITGGSIIGMATAEVSQSTFEDLDVGIQIGEQATPRIVDNDLNEMRSAALVFVGNSAGVAERNRITNPGIVGIQLGETAHPTLHENVLFSPLPDATSDSPSTDESAAADPEVGPAGEAEPAAVEEGATVGILYAGETAGKASNNQIVGFMIGIQVGESAAPDLVANSIDGGALLGVGILFRDDAGGTATGNETSGHTVGFQLGDSASPSLVANVVITARNVAFLVQGASHPVLTDNVCPDGLAGIGLLNGTNPERADNKCIEVLGE